jgi:hypothetical protein
MTLTYHVADLRGAACPREEHVFAAARGELLGSAARAAQELAGLDGAGSGKAGESSDKD